MIEYDNQLKEVLTVSAITSLIDTFSDSVATYPAIFNANVLPSYFKGAKSINFYVASPISGGLEYANILFTVNCRANSYPESRAIQDMVFNTINREKSSLGGFFKCDILATIPPQDETDNFNSIVEILLRA